MPIPGRRWYKMLTSCYIHELMPRALPSCSFPRQVEVDIGPAPLGEGARHATKCGLKLHPHWHHSIACDHVGIPDFAPPVGVHVAVGIDREILAHDLADLRRTDKVLIPVSRQHFPLNIGEPEIVKPAAVKDGNCQGTVPRWASW